MCRAGEVQPSDVNHRTVAKARLFISSAFSGKVKVDKEKCNMERKLWETRVS